MNGERYVVAGVAHVRSPWFTDVARWSTSGTLPIEFVKCLSLEALVARVQDGTPLSAALLDARLPGVDGTLVASLTALGVAPLVVGIGGDGVDIVTPFGPTDLLGALEATARPVGPRDTPRADVASAPSEDADPSWRAPLVTVTGAPGSGTSTVAACLAQGLAARAGRRDGVVLLDLARRAHGAILHDARDVLPALPELVAGVRDRPTARVLDDVAFTVARRGYGLVLGMRTVREWDEADPLAVRCAVDHVRRERQVVVADVGERPIGHLGAAVEVTVGRASPTGLCDLVRILGADLHETNAPAIPSPSTHASLSSRIPRVVVLTHGPKRPRRRAELVAAVHELAADEEFEGPVFVPFRRGVDDIHRAVSRFPVALAAPVTTAVEQTLPEGCSIYQAPDP